MSKTSSPAGRSLDARASWATHGGDLPVPQPARLPAARSRTWTAFPYPEFGDYFQRLGLSPLRDQIEPLILFESARGCWWVSKNQCTFCGLNGGSIAFRSKSTSRVIDELRHLHLTHGMHKACATDNILDFRYFRSMYGQLFEKSPTGTWKPSMS